MKAIHFSVIITLSITIALLVGCQRTEQQVSLHEEYLTKDPVGENEFSPQEVWNPIFRDEATIEFENSINSIHQYVSNLGEESCWDGSYRKISIDGRVLCFCMEDIGNADEPCMCHVREAETLAFIKDNVGEFFIEDSETGDTLYKIKNSDSVFFLISIDENDIYKVWSFEIFLRPGQVMGTNPDLEIWNRIWLKHNLVGIEGLETLSHY